MNNSTIKKFFNNTIFFYLGILFIILVWILLSAVENNIFFPKIGEVFIDCFNLLVNMNNILILLTTLLKLLLAITLSYIISLVLSIISYKSNKFRSFISPFIALMRCTPVASLIIIMILLIGTKSTPLIITLFVIIPISYEATYTSLKSCDKDVIEETKLISKINLKIIFMVHIPMASNYLIANVLSCTGLGLKVLVMGEVLSQGMNTIGGQIQLARTTQESTRVISWTIILLLLVLLIEFIINYFKKRIESAV